MSEQYNATCDICGKPYKVCRSCQEIKTFQAWRTVTDTLPHYVIYLALAEYSRTKDKAVAKEQLSKCDLSEKDKFNSNIKTVIDEIFKEDKPVKIEYRKQVIQNKKATNEVANKNEKNIE